MTGKFIALSSRIRRAPRSRVLSYLLLFLISYGSSAEILHHHGLASVNSGEISANVFSDNGLNTSSSKTSPERDCTVCQFQRGLSSTEIFETFHLLAPTQNHASFPAELLSRDSLSTTASRGRAPPTTL